VIGDILFHPLLMPVAVACLAGFVCLILPRAFSSAVSLIASAAAVFFAWPIFRGVGASVSFGHHLMLRSDHLSGFVVLLATCFGFLISLYSIGFIKNLARERTYYACLLVTIGCSCGALVANDLLLLVVFWGILGVTLYLMTGISGPAAAAAAKKTFIIIGGSDSVLVLGIALFMLLSGSSRMDGQPLVLDGPLAYAAFAFLAVAAFAKAGAMPFHTWVPDCGEKAPATVAALLPASLDKLLGIYLLARMTHGLFLTDPTVNGFLMLIGAVTIILAVMMAMVQHDLKRLLSYHAVSQVGYMILGIGTGSALGLAGGLFHMVNHTIYKSCLFLSAGSIEQKTGTTDLDKLGGLANAMPFTLFAFAASALSISGIPPLNGFASKWMVYQGIIESGKGGGFLWVVWLTAAMVGSALTLASFVKVLHAAFGKKRAASLAGRDIKEVSYTMWVPMVVLSLGCIVFGIFSYRIPLHYLILPAVGEPVAFSGIWWAGPATVMLLVALAIGGLAYWFTTVKKARECETYVGGEDLREVYISGETAAKTDRDVEVTGTDFYRTIQDMPLFKTFYELSARKLFDLYDVGAGVVSYFAGLSRKAHNGSLPMYMTWFLAGALIVMALLVGF
jgi:formate hydrogenlyase subunit 3/multisubunit Na+/H+ antiporter MnhD subunit